MGLNRYQLTFESCGDHYQIYGRDIQDVMGGVTGGAGVYRQDVRREARRPPMFVGLAEQIKLQCSDITKVKITI